MAKLTPQLLAQKWARGLQNSGEAIKAGVQSVTQNPADAAIAAGESYIRNVTEAYNSGKWAAGLRKVTLQDWKTSMIEKGAANAVSGAKLGAIKMEKHEREIAPIRDAIVASLPPRGTIEQNLERSRQMAMQMHEARRAS